MPHSNVDMMEALRLTRQGRLQEAMAVLRGSTAVPESGIKREAEAGKAPILDMMPPSAETGSAWSAPPAASKPHAAPGMPLPLTGGFFDRLGKLDIAGGLAGSVGRTAKPAMPLPAGATFDEHTFTNEAGSRKYKLYVPSRYKGQALPLVVMLHGCNQTPDDFAMGTRMNECAEEQGLIVAYPAQSSAANPSRCWNWFNTSDQRRGQGEPSLLVGITQQIMHDVSIDKGRVYVAGLSAGGAAAAILGVNYPDLFAGVGVHSGLACGAARDMPSAFAAMRQGSGATAGRAHAAGVPPTIVFHADDDKVVNPVNGDQVMAQANVAKGLQTTIVGGTAEGGIGFTRTSGIDGAGRSMFEQWVLHSGGHAWSGGSAAGSYTEPRGPDASREMVRFFLQHSKEV
jgi:poly(hydroxyalkanoate) depolymerase family esterase